MEKGLLAVLAGSPAIAEGRVYPRVPQPAQFPLVRYRRLVSSRVRSITGSNSGPTSFGLQIDCMATGSGAYEAAKTMADQVRQRLDGYRGAWGASTCRFCVLENETDDLEQDGDRITHWVTQRYTVWTNDD